MSNATKSQCRVAVLAPISWRTPPRHYGPWELFASLLSEGLVRLGHDVTLFATADSVTQGRLVATSPSGWSEDPSIDTKVAECLHIASCFDRADEFDIIHNGFDFLPLTYAERVDTPVVTTVHGFSSPAILPVYERYNATTSYVAISIANRHPRLSYAATIHHGVDPDAFPLSVEPNPNSYLLFYGRIHPDKGTAEAIAVARKVGCPLVIAGIIQDHDYFNACVAPHIDGAQVRYVGSIGGSDRARLLGGAIALLHLIRFDEPFGFSVVEAMMCGTPVVACNRGSLPELISDQTGALVRDVPSAVAAVSQVCGLDRTEVHGEARRRFDFAVMAQRYSDLYARILSQ